MVMFFVSFQYRLWRKTRQPYAQLCFGTDPNRNFNSSWMTNGTSRNPCSDVFGGPRPFSEPETVALAKLITTLGSRVKAYLSLHSYGQYVLFPYGHTKDKAPHFDILVSTLNRGHMVDRFLVLISCLILEYNWYENR